MTRALTVAVLLLMAWVCPAHAQTFGTSKLIGIANQVLVQGINSGRDTRDVLLCFVPDVQHLASGKAWTPDQAGRSCSTANPVNALSPAVNSNCTGGFCTQSIYCNIDWRHTDTRMLMNMAYEMTGQWTKIDYTGISGFDNTASFTISPSDHPKCDAVISLGDMADQYTFAPSDPNNAENSCPAVYPDEETGCGGGKCYSNDPNSETWYQGLCDQTKHEWASTENFWRIIDAAGVPYLPLKGNHDSKSAFRRMMNRLSFTSKSFYFAREITDNQAWAISFPTGSGKSFCVIGLPDGQIDGTSTADGTTPAERTFLTNNVGCGSGQPTILVQHEVVGASASLDGPTKAFYGTTLADGTKSAILLLMGGHWLNNTSKKSFIGAGSTVCGPALNANCPFSHFRLYSNWQDVNRHVEAAAPYGMTSQDAIGGMYTIVRISPQASLVSAWDWNPYYRTTGIPANVTSGCAGCATSNISQSFNFDTRYP